YPRTLGQVRMIEEVAPLDLVVELRVPKKVLIDRLSKQLVHHGEDDITGEPLFKREDDAAEVVGRRLEVHAKTESKVVDYYRNHGNCVTMNGDKSTVVFQAVSEMMNDLLKKRAFG
ncbi:hypothetical protein TELCIR_20704, partial [Teladorsagia circumcincta]